jgi:hypothetical protein
MDGNPEIISKGQDEEYVTVMRLVLPIDGAEFVQGTYQSSHVDWDSPLVINLYQIENSSEDPIFQLGNNFRFGANMQLQNLPFSIFADNRGEYPCFYAQIVFPIRLNDWRRPSPEEIEQKKLTGIHSEDKKFALEVLNKLFSSNHYPANVRPLQYEDITNFVEQYFRKGDPQTSPLYQHLFLLDSRNAFKEAIIDYLGDDLLEHVSGFVTKKEGKDINTEADLHEVVMEAIIEVIKHHVENRHWIGAFWNEPHKIKVKGERRTIPKQPKKEPSIQQTLSVLLYETLSGLGIHVERETDEGVGSLDFKCLYTTKEHTPLCVSIEFKLAHNKDIEYDLKTQLPAYLTANKSTYGIYLVMWFKDDEGKFFKKPLKCTKAEMITNLRQVAESIQAERGFIITTEMIDASVKPSASKM